MEKRYFDLNTEPSKLCFILPYCNVLRTYGIDVSEEYLLGITKGLIFEYFYLHNSQKTKFPQATDDIVSIVGSKSQIHDELHYLFGIKFHEIFFQNSEEAFTWCKYHIEQKEMIIAFFDAFFLSYHPQYQDVHGQTNLVLYDWNSQKQQILFHDSHVTTIPVSTYTGELTRTQFLNSIILGDNIFNGRKIGIITSSFSNDPIVISLKQIVREQAKNMLSLEEPNKGICGMLALADEVAWWYSVWDDNQIKNVLRQMYHHISGRGGPAACRAVYGAFLSTYLSGQIKNIQKISQGFLEASKKWNVLSAKCFRYSLNFKKDNLESIAGCLREIAELENTLFIQLLGEDFFEDDFKSYKATEL